MTSLVVLLYRIALFGLPPGFRSRYGEGMVEEASLGLDEAWGRGRLTYLVAMGRLGATPIHRDAERVDRPAKLDAAIAG